MKEQQYNKGDVVVCRKTYKNYIANKKYLIVSVNSDSIVIENNSIMQTTNTFLLKNQSNFFCRNICPGRKDCIDPTFKEYFFTIKDSRKQKLSKLKKVR